MKKILFIDDEAFILQTIERKLEKTDLHGFYTTDPLYGLELVEKEDIDVVFTDLLMPQMNGLEVVEAINSKKPNCVVVVLSGNSQTSAIVKTMNTNHVFKYIVKPWKVDEEGIRFMQFCIEEAQRRKTVTSKAAAERDNLLISVECLNKVIQYRSWVLVDETDHILAKSIPVRNDLNLQIEISELERLPYEFIESNVGILKLYGRL